MITVNYNEHNIIHHPDLGKFTAEAAELGLAPGEWPDFIAVLRDGSPEGALFQRGASTTDGGAVSYWTKSGVELTVYND